MRENTIKYGFPLKLESIGAGKVVKGVVLGFRNNSASIAIKGCNYRGNLKFENIESTIKTEKIEDLLTVGQELKAKILLVKTAPKVRIELGTRTKFFEVRKRLKDLKRVLGK